MTTPDAETLANIQQLAERRITLKRELKDARSERLSATKEAIHELEERISESKAAKKTETAKHLKAIQAAHDERRRTIEETSDKVREATAAFKAADEAFEQAIIDSRQGSLFTSEEAQP